MSGQNFWRSPAFHQAFPWYMALGPAFMILIAFTDPRPVALPGAEYLLTAFCLISIPYLLQGLRQRIDQPLHSRAILVRFGGMVALLHGILALGYCLAVKQVPWNDELGNVIVQIWMTGVDPVDGSGLALHGLPVVALISFLWLTVNWIGVSAFAWSRTSSPDRAHIAAVVIETQPLMLLAALPVTGALIGAVAMTFFVQRVLLDRPAGAR